MRRADAGFAVVACGALSAYNNVIGLCSWHRRRYVALNLCAAGVAASAAAASGLTPADLGIGSGRWRPGWPAASLAAGLAAGWLLVAAIPAVRPVLDDKRVTSLEPRQVAYQAAVRIPAGTVLWEEVAFRGVLQAALLRVVSERAAIGTTAAVFGIWHLRPTIEALRANGMAAGRRQAVARGMAGSVAMAGAGVLLSWLRARSGSLAAPALVHLAANSGGVIAAWAVSERPRSRP